MRSRSHLLSGPADRPGRKVGRGTAQLPVGGRLLPLVSGGTVAELLAEGPITGGPAETHALAVACRLLLSSHATADRAKALSGVLGSACRLLNVGCAACYVPRRANGFACLSTDEHSVTIGAELLEAIVERVVVDGSVVIVDRDRPNELIQRTVLCVPVHDALGIAGALLLLDKRGAFHPPHDLQTASLLALVAGTLVTRGSDVLRDSNDGWLTPTAVAPSLATERAAHAEALASARAEAAELARALSAEREARALVERGRDVAAMRALHAEEQLRSERERAEDLTLKLRALRGELDSRLALGQLALSEAELRGSAL